MAGGAETTRDRISRLEEIVGAPQSHDDVSLTVQAEQTVVELQTLHTELGKFMTETNSKLAEIANDILSVTELFKAHLKELEDEVALLKRAQQNQILVGEKPTSKIKIPEPKPFGGKRSAKELENFLWDVEQYFRAAHIPEDDRVTITSMYLSGDAKLWWRTRQEDDARPQIRTWSDLRKELRETFLPTNSGWVARDALRKLKHNGSVREYVKDFTSLLLDIKDMSEEDKLFNFVAGLQSWAQIELRRRGVRDLPSAIVAADSLVDLRIEKLDSVHGKPKKNGKFFDKTKKNGAEKDKEIPESSNQQQKQKFFESGCFICKGPHRARDCPRKEKALSALTAKESDDEDSDTETSIRVNPLILVDDDQAWGLKSKK